MAEIMKILRRITDAVSGGGTDGYFCSCVLVAAGNGSRMGDTPYPKQLAPLLDVPVLIRSAMAFEQCSFIREIVIVTRENDREEVLSLIKKHGLKKVRRLVLGGETRQQSALNGFEALDEKCEYAAIHDAARCLVTPDIIERVFRAAIRYGAAIAACKAADTVKIEGDGGFIESTPERSSLWYAQTPQVFKSEIYRAAAYYCKEHGADVTDDASLAESAGFPVKLVDCGSANIKITTPIDLLTAEAELRRREEEQAKK